MMSWQGNRKPVPGRAAAAADESCCGSRVGDAYSEDAQTGLTSRALDEFRIRCPNCSHRFGLSEGLVEEGIRGLDSKTGASGEADTEHGSLESLGVDAPHPFAPAPSGSNYPAVSLANAAGAPKNSSPESQFSNQPDASGSDGDAHVGSFTNGGEGEDSKSSQPISRQFQIINRTVEELERVICDLSDRRIRKICSLTQCDIEVRSELASTKFGAPKNYCILRAAQSVSIDQCCGMLRRQMLWVLKPKAPETSGTGDPAAPGH